MRYYCSLLITLLTVAFSNLSAQVSFTADKVEGCGTLTVKFTAVSGGSIQKTLWDFGNGRRSSELSPTYTYTIPGSYTVKLTVNDSASAIVKSDYIRVRNLPDARFHIVDSLKSGPYIFNLFATQQPVDTFTYTYNWSFSDISTSTGPIVVHQFDSSGIYMANLKVTDGFGCADSFQHIITASSRIIVPNVFTPNGDHVNDVLEVQTNGRSKYIFKVFSFSGTVVFDLESVNISWSGENLSGAKLSQGIYYYTIESLDTGNPFRQSGFIYLLY